MYMVVMFEYFEFKELKKPTNNYKMYRAPHSKNWAIFSGFRDQKTTIVVFTHKKSSFWPDLLGSVSSQ